MPLHELPSYAEPDEKQKVVTVETFSQAIAVSDLIPDDWSVVISDRKESLDAAKTIKAFQRAGLVGR